MQNRYTIQIVRSPSTCKRWLIASGDDSAGPPRAERSAVFGFQVRNTASNDHSIFVPAPSPPPQPPLSPNTPPLPARCLFKFYRRGTFSSSAPSPVLRGERHYASVIMQFITNNRFVYGPPAPVARSLSALHFQNNNNNT